MGVFFSFISELQSIRERKSKLSERESELTEPIISDKNLISDIYGKFIEIINRASLEPFVESPTQRKKFIFIILCLYAPSSLAGGRLPHGLREKISEVTHAHPVFISQNIENVVFQCQNIKDFRKELSHIYEEIEAYLRDKGAIK